MTFRLSVHSLLSYRAPFFCTICCCSPRALEPCSVQTAVLQRKPHRFKPPPAPDSELSAQWDHSTLLGCHIVSCGRKLSSDGEKVWLRKLPTSKTERTAALDCPCPKPGNRRLEGLIQDRGCQAWEELALCQLLCPGWKRSQKSPRCTCQVKGCFLRETLFSPSKCDVSVLWF